MEENTNNTNNTNTERLTEDFDKILTEELTNRLKESYNKGVTDGVMAGWDACIQYMYSNIKNMTSANKIHKFTKKEMDEVKARGRIVVNKEETDEG